MKTNLVFRIIKDTLIISEIKKNVDEDKLNNTNIIDVKDLKFSIDYIIQNKELVSNFLNVVIIKKNIKNVQINNIQYAKILMDIINEWDHIEKLIFKEDIKIPLDIVLKILDNNYIREVECYEMVNYLIERLDVNKNLKVKTRHEIKSESLFIKENFLNSFSDIYYKKSIIISSDFNKNELDDIRNFMGINNLLKKIKIYKFSNELITSLIEEIEKYNKCGIIIEIYEENNDYNMIIKTINYLKKHYRKLFEDNNIQIKIKYSKEYKKNNFIKEINLKLLSAIILFIIALVLSVTLIKYYKEYLDEASINSQLDNITKILDDNQKYISIDNNESDIDIVEPGNIEVETTTKRPSYMESYYTDYQQVFDSLKKINSDTVAWIKIENTKINYPVVQDGTNSYYLEHAYDKKHNTMGWIFMDKRNNPENLDQNTIIYGHNVKSGLMFGTLKYLLNDSWYKVPSNQIITFNTPYKNMKWQIFSVYRREESTEYLKNEFNSKEEFMEFINSIKQRSRYDFGIEIKDTDKILTLSTCYTNTTRTVVHAVLIEDENE